MALNQSHFNGGVLIHNGEWILLYCDGVELKLDGADEAAMKGTKKGRLYLTSHRIIFTSKDSKDQLQSFAIPFTSLSSVDIDQPIFGANAIKGQVKSLPGGNWAGIAKFRLSFSHGGAIEFGQAMLQAAKMATRNAPPPYTPPYGAAGQTDSNFYNPPPAYYYAQQTSVEGFELPKDKFPSAPPVGDVYMTDQPPPYASIFSNPPQPSAPAAGYAGAGYPSAPAGMYPNLSNGPAGYAGAPPPYAAAGAKQ